MCPNWNFRNYSKILSSDVPIRSNDEEDRQHDRTGQNRLGFACASASPPVIPRRRDGFAPAQAASFSIHSILNQLTQIIYHFIHRICRLLKTAFVALESVLLMESSSTDTHSRPSIDHVRTGPQGPSLSPACRCSFCFSSALVGPKGPVSDVGS